MSRLQQVLTFGEVLEPQCRALCERAFQAKVVDLYSSQEVGYFAFQCPDCHDYHVQSENVLLEVLDDAGRPCEVGHFGKVVVTSLHNFAMPLVRYELPPFFQFQVVQRTLEELDLNVVRPGGELSPTEHIMVEQYFQRVLVLCHSLIFG